MAVPKRKVSPSRKKIRAHNMDVQFKSKSSTYISCKLSQIPKKPHDICLHCMSKYTEELVK